MANTEALYETGERHTRYVRDTNLFLVELITTAKRMTTADTWQQRTGYLTETPIKDLSTRAFKEVARLLRSEAGESIVLSRLAKLALDRAILDRKDQASFFRVISTRSDQSERIYDTHIYFIKALEEMRRTLLPLFEATTTSSPTVPKPRSWSLYGTLKVEHPKDQSAATKSIVGLGKKSNPSDETTNLFWSIIYAYTRDVLEIRAHLDTLVTQYDRKEISLMGLYPVIHAALYLVEERTAALLDEESRLLESCPEEFGLKFKEYGVAGVLHFAFQEHESHARKETKLMTRAKQESLAKVGLDFFLSPTVAKVLQYRSLKSQRDAGYLTRLARTDKAIPFGDSLATTNHQVLDVKDGALYEASWYEDTTNVLLQEYSRMASLDKLIGHPRFPTHDALTGILSQSLLGLSKKHEDLSATCLFHIVLDMRKRLAADEDRIYKEAQNIAQQLDKAYNEYYQSLENPPRFLKSPIDIIRRLILADPMVITPKFGQKRLRALSNADQVLGSTEAHLSRSEPNALKRYNPVLSGHLAFAAIDSFRKGTAQIDEIAPNTLAFLFLYIGLKMNNCLSQDYPDAEQVIAWFGEQSVFGANGRPETMSDLLSHLRTVIRRQVRWDFQPEAAIETLFRPFLADSSKEYWDNLRAHLIEQYRVSSIAKDRDAAETGNDAQTSESESAVTSTPLASKVKSKPSKKIPPKPSTSTPRPTDLLLTMQSLYTRDMQLRASFNFLAFRTRVTRILELCAELLIQNGICIIEKHMGEPEEFLLFVELFWLVRGKAPREWAIVKDEVVKMIEDVVANKGRMEVDAAEEMCGWKK